MEAPARSAPMKRLQRILALVSLGAATLAAAGPLRETDADVDGIIDRLHGDHAPFRDAFDRLQQAVAAHDGAAVAALVRFPLEATAGRARVAVATPAEFVAQYDRIVTPAIAAVIARQAWDALFVNAHGVMLGDGQVWLAGECADKACSAMQVRVVTIQDGPHITPQ
jgi:hypothetical protein